MIGFKNTWNPTKKLKNGLGKSSLTAQQVLCFNVHVPAACWRPATAKPWPGNSKKSTTRLSMGMIIVGCLSTVFEVVGEFLFGFGSNTSNCFGR